MRSLKLTLNQVMLMVVLAILSGSCNPTTPTSDVDSLATTSPVTRTATSTSTPTSTALSSPMLDTLTGWPGVQGNPEHTGETDQEFPIAFEPKWVAQPNPPFSDEPLYYHEKIFSHSAIVADDEIVVVGDVPNNLAEHESMSAYHDNGPNHRVGKNVDPAGYALYAFRVTDGVQKWRYATGGLLVGAPQIVDGKVYAVTWQPPTDTDKRKVSNIFCLDSEDGSLIWKTAIQDTIVGAVSIDDGVMVIPGEFDETPDQVGDAVIKVFGLDIVSGQLLWTTNMVEHDSNNIPLYAAAISDGRAYLVGDRSVYALDLQTGEIIWRASQDNYLKSLSGSSGLDYNGPIVAVDGRLFIATLDAIYALDARDGQILWKYQAWVNQSSGWSYDRDQKMLLFFSHSFLVALDTTNGAELWKTGLGDYFHNALIGYNGKILTGGGLLDQGSGEFLWKTNPDQAALPWSKGTRSKNIFQLTLEEWLPDDYVLNSDGETVLLSGFVPWGDEPAVSGGLVIGWSDSRKIWIPSSEPQKNKKDLVAFGPDTTPPYVRFNPEPWNGQWGRIFGTVYDYNLKEWSLEIRSDQAQSGWKLIAKGTTSQQGSAFLDSYIEKWPDKLTDGVWTLRLTASDTSGLTSTDEMTHIVDETPPLVEITSPKTGYAVGENMFTLQGTASDINGIASVRIFSNQGSLSTLASGTTNWNLPITVTPAMEGKTITYYAKATDTFGNTAISNKVTLTFPRFQLSLQAGGRRLVGTRSMFTDPAEDIDGDGIEQRWESEIIRLTMPILELDEEEDWLNQFKENLLGQRVNPQQAMTYFVRVTGYTPQIYESENRTYPDYYLLVYIAFGWAQDYGAVGGALEAHRGDSENVVMAWRVTGETTAELEWVRTSSHKSVNRHHGLWNAWQHSCTLANIAFNPNITGDTEMMCSELEFEANGRLVLYPGEDKHALYPTTKVCEDANLLMPGYGEDCGWEPLTNIIGGTKYSQWEDSDFNRDARYQGGGRWLFDAYNVGEPDPCRRYQLIDFLDEPETWVDLTAAQKHALTGLYPYEAVWSGTFGYRAKWEDVDDPDNCTLEVGNDGGGDFCGGLGMGVPPKDCSSKIGGVLGQTNDWKDGGPPDLISEALEARYMVSIKTGSMDTSGTDANISLTLSHNGQRGETIYIYSGVPVTFNSLLLIMNGINAPYPYVGSFERGSTDFIFLDDSTPGEINGITLSQDGRGDHPGWYVEQVMVRDLLTGKIWAARPQRWLATDSYPYSTSAYISLSPYSPDLFDTVEYQVIVTTGDKGDAGTDGNVSITLTGSEAILSGYLLDDPTTNDFERNTQGTYYFSTQDLGQLESLRVQLEIDGNKPDWYCQDVMVRNVMTGQVWMFTIDSWLGKGNGPLSVEVLPND